MKRRRDILIVGIVLAMVVYAGLYFSSTARHRGWLQASEPELAWLKAKFGLSDAEFNRISEIHAAYQPKCAEMCRRIDTIQNELRDLLSKANMVTPEVEAKLAQAAQVRFECQTMMLRHFVEVSRNMPLEQGKRYLEWVQQQAFGPAHRMATMHSAGPDSSHHE